MASLEATASEQIFSSLNPDEIASELAVEQRALHDGSRDRPATSDSGLSGAEREIVDEFRRRLLAAKHQARTILQDLRGRRINADLNKVLQDANTLETCQAIELEQLQIQRRNDLNLRRNQYESTQRDLRLFKAEHKLAPAAHYSESNNWFWGLLALIVVVESALNAMFFAQGSDLGFLGGLMQAIIISIINVAFALGGAEILRQCYHRQFSRKMFGFIGMALYLAIAICFNLFVAHYRAQIDLDPFEAVVATLQAFKADPLGVDNFHAWLLFIIGVVSAALAFVKRFYHKDSYPGYSRVTKAHKEAEHAWIEAYQQSLQALQDLRVEGERCLDNLRIEAKRIITDYDQLLYTSKSMIDQFAQYALQVEDVCHAVLTRYRMVNQNVRSTPPPEYFSERPKFEDDIHQFKSDFKQDDEQLQAMKQKLAEYDEVRFEDIRRTLHAMYIKHLKDLENRYGEIKTTGLSPSQEPSAASLDVHSHRLEIVNAAAAAKPKQTRVATGQ